MKSSAISHNPAETFDWAFIRSEHPQVAAARLGAILRDLEHSEKRIFATRGMAMLLIEERQLWEQFTDPEVDQPYASFDRWMKVTLPNSWGYCRDALRAVKELKDLPFEDLLQIKRVNLEQLKKVSSSVRLLPEVVDAAKTLPEKQFVEKMNQEHSQHLETRAPVVMADSGDVEEFEQAILMAMACEECKTRAEAIRAISISYIVDHEAAYDHLGEKTA